jgi:hypothetical protein
MFPIRISARLLRHSGRPLFTLALFTFSLSTGCTDPLVPDAGSDPETAEPQYAALHSATVQVSPGFAFLPPIAPAASHTGVFNASLSPVVTICEWTGRSCALPLLAEFDTEGRGKERVRVSLEDEHYIVNWSTREISPDLSRTYRVSVAVAGAELGHADVKVLRSASEKRSIDSSRFVAVVKGQVLPVKFRIESSGASTPSGGVLYALSYVGEWQQGEQRILRIDPSTGAVSVAVMIRGVHTTATETAIDPESGRFFFAGGEGGGPGSTLLRYAVNVHTGEIHTFGAPVTWPEGNEHGWQFSN